MAGISPRLAEVIRLRPDWYNNEEFKKIHATLFAEGDGTEVETLTEETWQVIGWFVIAMGKQQVALGSVKPGFNDDDVPGRFAGFLTVPRDTVIVHHTATKETLSIPELEVLGLLRLYLIQYMSAEPSDFIKFLRHTNPQIHPDSPLAPASGHYVLRDGKEIQSFVGYHYLIYPDGHVVKLLDHDMMAFNAGNLAVNKRCIAIAYVGNFLEKAPTQVAQNAGIQLIQSLNTGGIEIGYLDTHKHVRLKKETKCPGPWFDKWARSPELAHLKPVPILPPKTT